MNSNALRIQVVQAAAGDPVSLSEAALHCRVDSSVDHPALQAMIRAATSAAEQYLGRPILTRTYRQFFDAWPCGRFLELRRSPLVSVTTVKTYTDADVSATFAASSYFVDTVSLPGRIVLRSSASWPTAERVANAIEVEYRAGYGTDPASVPADIRQAVLMLTANLYEHRGETVTGSMPDTMARQGAFDLLAMYREILI
jgi:uncharacterized phiE125 gp8 family phage protein